MFTRGLRLIPSIALRTRRTRNAPTAPAIPPRDLAVLRGMADNSGWIERGGLALGARTTFEESRGIKSREQMHARTHWVGQPEWARGFGYSKAAIQSITERGIAGKRLGRKQQRLFQAMRDALSEADQWKEENHE